MKKGIRAKEAEIEEKQRLRAEKAEADKCKTKKLSKYKYPFTNISWSSDKLYLSPHAGNVQFMHSFSIHLINKKTVMLTMTATMKVL